MNRGFLWVFILVLVCVGGGWLTSCSAPTFSLSVYYWPDELVSPPVTALVRPKLQKMFFFVRSSDNEQHKAWKPVLSAGNSELPLLPCTKEPSVPGLDLLVGSLRSLTPFVEILAYDSDVSADANGQLPTPSLVGRFSLEVVCQQPLEGDRSASVFLAPPLSMMPWKGSNAKSVNHANLGQRIGHSVTRLSDGRYVIVGGLQQFVYRDQDSGNTSWNSHIAIYQPANGEIELVDKGLSRAFHTVIVRDNRLFLSGGIIPNGKGGIELAKGVEVLEFSQGTKQWELRKANSQETGGDEPSISRAFQQVVQIPVTAAQDSSTPQFQFVALGGITKLPPNEPTSSEGLQVLFHSVISVPADDKNPQQVLMTGGAYRGKDSVFRASQAGLSFEVSSDGKLNQTDDAQSLAAVLKSPRAGHAAVALNATQVLVLGGFAGGLGTKHQIQGTVEILQRVGKIWKSMAICPRSEDKLLHRMFHSMTVLREGSAQGVRILVSGGVTPDKKPAPSFVLVWEPGSQPICAQFQYQTLDHPYNATVYGMHSATLMETGQVMLIGGGDISIQPSNDDTIQLSGQSTSAWFTPGPFNGLSSIFGSVGPTEKAKEPDKEGVHDGGDITNERPDDGDTDKPKPPEIPEEPPIDQPPVEPALMCQKKETGAVVGQPCGWARTLRNTPMVSDDGKTSPFGAVAVDHSGTQSHYVVAGSYRDSFRECGGKQPTFRGERDILLAKFRSDGSCVWAVGAGGTGDDKALSVAVDGTGQIYVTGFIQGQATFGDQVVVGSDTKERCKNAPTDQNCEQDMFMAKYSSAGRLIWVKSVAGRGRDFGTSITVSTFGLFVAGAFSGLEKGVFQFSNTTLKNNGTYSMLVGKLDPKTGEWIWANSADTSGGTGVGSSVVVSSRGTVYLAGNFESKECKFLATTNNTGIELQNKDLAQGSIASDGFIARIDEKGKFTNVFSVGGPGDDFVRDVKVVGTNQVEKTVYAVGSFASSITLSPRVKLSSTVGTSGFVAQFTPTLGFITARQLSPINTSSTSEKPQVVASSVAIDGEHVYVLGSFVDGLRVGDTAVQVTAGRSGLHMWMAHMDASLLRIQKIHTTTNANPSLTSQELSLNLALDPKVRVPIALGYRSGTTTIAGSTCSSPSKEMSLFLWRLPTSACQWGVLSEVQTRTGSRTIRWMGHDSGGSLYTVGSFSGTLSWAGSTLSCSSTIEQAFMARWSRDGQLVWLQCLGAQGGRATSAVVQEGRTSYLYIVGMFQKTLSYTMFSNGSFVSKKVVSQGGTDIFVAQMDLQSGRILQLSAGGSTGADEANSVASGSGTLFVAGTLRGQPSWGVSGASSVPKTGQATAFVATFSLPSLASPQAFVPFVTTGREGSSGLEVQWDSKTSQAYTAGVFLRKFKTDKIPWKGQNGASSSATDIYVVALKPGGGVSWARTYGGSGSETLQTLKVGPKGGLYLAGDFLGTTSWGLNRPVRSVGLFRDSFLVKLDSQQGQPTWKITMGGRYNDSTTRLVFDINGGLYAAGHFTSTTSVQDNSATKKELRSPTGEPFAMFLAKVEQGGIISSARTMGETTFSTSSIGGLVYRNGWFVMSGTLSNPLLFESVIHRPFAPSASFVRTGRALFLNTFPSPWP